MSAMPLYAFECASCKAEFETLVRSSDTPACPKCSSTKLDRLLSRIARPSKVGEDAMGCAGGGCAMPGMAASAGPCCMGGVHNH